MYACACNYVLIKLITNILPCERVYTHRSLLYNDNKVLSYMIFCNIFLNTVSDHNWHQLSEYLKYIVIAIKQMIIKKWFIYDEWFKNTPCRL